jgi:hypothetical protein
MTPPPSAVGNHGIQMPLYSQSNARDRLACFLPCNTSHGCSRRSRALQGEWPSTRVRPSLKLPAALASGSPRWVLATSVGVTAPQTMRTVDRSWALYPGPPHPKNNHNGRSPILGAVGTESPCGGLHGDGTTLRSLPYLSEKHFAVKVVVKNNCRRRWGGDFFG